MNVPKPKFTMQIGIGHIFQALALVIGGTLIYAELRANDKALETQFSTMIEKLEDYDSDMRRNAASITDRINAAAVRISVLEREAVRTDERWSSINDIMTEIRNQNRAVVERLSQAERLLYGLANGNRTDRQNTPSQSAQ